jgi:non-ribosomal peptide synthetase component F/NRPS condensation-like uncharacterized protein
VSPSPAVLAGKSAPLSFAQERLWIIDAADPGAPTYNVPILLRWSERVDPAALGRAFDAVVARHETLRTVYRIRDEEPVQIVQPQAPMSVRTIEAQGRSWADVRADALAEGRRPFDLAAGPVLRATAYAGLTDGDAVLIVVHHIAFDGWSMGRFCTDLAYAYAAVTSGRTPELAERAPSYAEFARRDRDAQLGAGARAAIEQRAAELLVTGPPLDLAGALPRAAGRRVVRDGAEALVQIPDQVWSRVSTVAAAHRVTPFVVLHGALQVLLSLWSDRQEFRVGVVSANRADAESEDAVGFFVNTVPLRGDVRAGETFGQLCRRARGEAFRATTYQRIPYDLLTAAAHTELVEVAFALQNYPVPAAGVPVRWGIPEVLATGTAKFDLLLTVEERDSGWWARLEYDTARYPQQVAERLVRSYAELLDAVTADAGIPITRLAGFGPGADLAVRRTDATTPQPPASRPSRPRDGSTDDAAKLFLAVLADQPESAGGLSVEDLGPESDFFALGGHSLLVIRMLRHIERTVGTTLLARDFLGDPTVAGLAALLAAPPARRAPTAVDAESRLRSTAAQQRFWSIDRLPWLRSAYLVPTVVEFTGAVDAARLRTAVRTVLGRHPALRSRFSLDRKQRAVFYRTDAPEPEVTLVDAAAWPEDELWRTVGEESWTGFDLARDALARARLLRRSDGSVVLVIVAHHIVFDGWSRHLVLEQIGAAYRGAELAEPVHPAGQEDTDEDVVRSHTEAVIAALDGAPVDVALPRDRPRPPMQETLGATVRESLGAERTRKLRAIAANNGCTTFMVTVALYAVAIARIGGQRDMVMALPWSDRNGSRSETAVGMFVDTLALRMDVSGELTWPDLLARARGVCAHTFRHSAARFDTVATTVDAERDLSRPPLTPIYLNAEDRALAPPDAGPAVEATVLPLRPLHVKYELELTVTDHRDDIDIELAYAVALFDPATATAILGAVVTAADDLISRPTACPLKGD